MKSTMADKAKALETFPGARYWRSMQGSVDAILTPLGIKRQVLSMGTQFVNFDAWTGEAFAQHLCHFLAKHPTKMPDPRELRAVIDAANKTRARNPHIRVARMPDRVTLRVARAIIGGGYHEAFHTKYSKRDRVRISEVQPIIDIGEQVTLAGGKWDAKMRGLLMTLHHLVEDIRIERRGNEDFEGAKQAMIDLQDFILDLEAAGRAKGAKVKNVTVSMNARSILLCAFRDLGLGYNSHKARQALDFYKQNAPGAVGLLAPGGLLAPMVHEAKTLERDDLMGSLRVAMKIVVELWRVTQQESEDEEDDTMKCPQCGAPPKDLIIRSVKNDQGVKIKGRAELECKICGFKHEFDLPDNSLNLNQQQKEQEEKDDQEQPEVEDLDQDDVGEGADGFGDDTREKMRDQKPEKSDSKEDQSAGQSGGDEGDDSGADESEAAQGSRGGDDEESGDESDEDSEGASGGAQEDPEEGTGDEESDEERAGGGAGEDDADDSEEEDGAGSQEGDDTEEEEESGRGAGRSDEDEDGADEDGEEKSSGASEDDGDDEEGDSSEGADDGDDPDFDDLDGLVDDGDEDEESESAEDGEASEDGDEDGDEGDEGDDDEDWDADEDGEASDDDEDWDEEGEEGEEGDDEGEEGDSEGAEDSEDGDEGADSDDGSQSSDEAAANEEGEDEDWEMDGETFCEQGGGFGDLGRDFDADQENAEEVLGGGENDGVMTNQTALDEALAHQTAKEERDVKAGERIWNPYNPMIDEARLIRTKDAAKDLEAANKMLGEVRSTVTYLRARLRTIVKAQEMTEVAHGVRRGRKMSQRMLVDTAIDIRSGRMPTRAYQVSDAKIDTSIDMAICLDQSSSMSSMKRKVAQVMMILADSVEGVGGSTFAFGFRNGEYVSDGPRNYNHNFHRIHGVRYDVFKTWEENFTNTKARFAHTTAHGSTPMADGVQFGLQALEGRQAAHRILAVITDGAPDPPHEQVIRRQIRIANEAGIRIIGIGIGNGARYVKGLFGESNAVWAQNVAEMPNALLKKLNELCDFSGRFRGRRAKLDGKGKMTKKVS